MERSYTVSEIDRMRAAILRWRTSTCWSHKANEPVIYTEEVLRTYLAAGSDPDDVVIHYETMWRDYINWKSEEQRLYSEFYLKHNSQAQWQPPT